MKVTEKVEEEKKQVGTLWL